MRSLGVFDDEQQGVVPASGELSITFTCPLNQSWNVQQLTLEMPTAPAGATAEVRKGSAPVAPSPDARYASAGGDPPIPVRAGQAISAVWHDATPGDIAKAYMVYEKMVF